MLSVRVAGQDVRNFGMGNTGPVTVEYGRHGSEAASWELGPNKAHPLMRGNALVDVYDGGFPIWNGTLVEPSEDGLFTARGLWHQAENVYPMDAAANITTVIDSAIIASVNNRQELNWGLPLSISGAAWATTGTPEGMVLTDLLDGFAAENAMNWYIDATRGCRMAALPTTPQWIVPHAVAGTGLTPAEDEFFSHLIGSYKDAGGVYRRVIVGSADAQAVFGRRTLLVDLSDLGNSNSTRATAVLQGMLLKSGARMGFGEGLELSLGQIVTPGSTLATLAQVCSLQAVRLCGTIDTSRPYLVRADTDGVIETLKYTDGSKKITLTLFGYAPRSFEDIFDEALAS